MLQSAGNSRIWRMRFFMVFAVLCLLAAGLMPKFADRLVPQQAGRQQIAAAAVTSTPEVSYGRKVVVPRDARGHFQVDARVDGRQLGFMIDTGASTIALTASDARRVGIHPVRNDYTVNVRTANGNVRAAPVRIGMIEVGGLVVRDVPALVAPDEALSENLLGLSFLTKLKRFEYSDGKLVLEQ
jgi:aspartyl protease family protein